MIRHMLLFRFRADVDTNERQALLRELSLLPKQFPAIQHFELGRNASERDDRFEHGMTMTFQNRDELDDYLRSSRHETFVTERFRPLISDRAIVSMDVLEQQQKIGE